MNNPFVLQDYTGEGYYILYEDSSVFGGPYTSLQEVEDEIAYAQKAFEVDPRLLRVVMTIPSPQST